MLTALSINKGSCKETQEQMSNIIDYISGEISSDSLNFLREICEKNPYGLEKIIKKFKSLQIKPKAHLIDLVINAINKQISIPENILSTIQAHLSNTQIDNMAQVLNLFSTKLEKNLLDNDDLQYVLQIINNLKIFINPSQEEKFIKSIIVLMLNFHHKQINNNKAHSRKKVNFTEAAKWIKSLLSISEKSSLIQLIDYIAVRLYINQETLIGLKQNMELTELYTIFEDLALNADMEVYTEKNKPFLQNINAIILIDLICVKNPMAFIDIVSVQINNPIKNIYAQIKNYFENNLILNDFFHGAKFQKYYKNTHDMNESNIHAFTITFSNHLLDSYNSVINIKQITDFLHHAFEKCDNYDEKNFNAFIQRMSFTKLFEEKFINNFLPELELRALTKLKRHGSFSFIANKLVSMGFSPKAQNFKNTGVFQSLITLQTLQKDVQNIKALRLYFNDIPENTKTQLIRELLLTLLVRYRAHPCKLENQPKPFNKKYIRANSLPVLNNIKKANNSNRLNSQKSWVEYNLTLFKNNPTDGKKIDFEKLHNQSGFSF